MLSEKKLAALAKATEAAAVKKRAQTHCIRGHRLDASNNRGWRFCKTCRADNTDRTRALGLAQLKANSKDTRHGTTTGAQYGCKCVRCKLARNRYSRDLRRRKRLDKAA